MSLHLFKEYSGGDVYAARDLEHAKELWTKDTGLPGLDNEWGAIPDSAELCVDDVLDPESGILSAKGMTDGEGKPTPRGYRRIKAGEYAAECSAAGCVGSFD